MTRMRRLESAAWLLTVVAAATVVLAVQSVNVEHTSTADFQEGLFEDVVPNNLGELKLSRKLDVLLKEDKDVVFVHALAADDKGAVYAATAPAGKLFKMSPAGPCELYYTAEQKTLQSLAVGPKGELYVGTGGGEGKILRVLAKDKAQVVLEKPGLAYVWAMAVLPDGRIVAGTGPDGELILVTPGDKPSAGEVLYKPEKERFKNVLSLVAAGGKTVYFGTDTDGLVFKFDLEARRPFLLYDAEEAEVSCLAIGADGVVYAATADPEHGADGEHAPGDRNGHPDGPDSGPDDDLGPDEEADDPSAGEPAEPVGLRRTRPADRLARPAARLAAREDSFTRIGRAMTAPPATQPEEAGPTRPSGSAAAKDAPKPPTTQPGPQTRRPDRKNGPPPMIIRMDRPFPGRPVRGGPGGGEGEGNAVYRIDPQGFVTEVLRQPTLMLSLLLQGNRLIVGTGTDGRVLALTPGSEEIETLAKPKDVKQVLALAPGRDGTILIGTANEAMIARIGTGFTPRGTFTSTPIDASQISRWGVIHQRSSLPQGTSVRVQTRTGNLAEPDDSLWSAWSEPALAAEPVAIASPAARFIQYRVILSTDRPEATPAVDSVTISYVNENLPPKLIAVRAVPPGSKAEDGENGPRPRQGKMMAIMVRPPQPMRGPRSGGPDREDAAPTGIVGLNWEATDPNEDTLEFMLYFRRAGTTVWVPMLEKPIQEDNFEWDTHGLPDGQYQVKVVASDLPGNPASLAKEDSRITDPVTVDNTPPVINNFRVVQNQAGKVTFAADLTDALSRLASALVRVDSSVADGQVVEPVDSIWDQRNESLRFVVDLSGRPGSAHMVIVTVTDAAGNTASAALEVAKP